MASVNYFNGEIWIGAGLTWNYFFHPLSGRYHDISCSPRFDTPAGSSVEILRKWNVNQPNQIQLFIQIINHNPYPVYFEWNICDVAP